MYEGDAFRCARGCFECKAYKENPVGLPLDDSFDFYCDVNDFFLKDRVQHKHLSSNHFGDFIEDFDQYRLGIDTLKKARLLEPDKYQEVDLFMNMEKLTPEMDAKIKEFLLGWDYSIKLRLGMSL